MPPLQQPVEHVLTSHEQVPFVVSQTPFEHGEHKAPACPHFVGVSEAYPTQVVPLQQPLVQDDVLQMHMPVTVLHAWPVPQLEHDAPPLPHWPNDSEAYGTHVLPLQQPAGHEVASQTHCPVTLSHSWPMLHGAHAAPLAPHEEFDSLVSASQVEPPLQHPVHVPPHVQTPLEQLSPLPQAAHVAPFVPHCMEVCEA